MFMPTCPSSARRPRAQQTMTTSVWGNPVLMDRLRGRPAFARRAPRGLSRGPGPVAVDPAALRRAGAAGRDAEHHPGGRASRSRSSCRGSRRSPWRCTPSSRSCVGAPRAGIARRPSARGRLGPSGAGATPHRAASIARMTDRPADLDVVVLGGGGHVGLPLSLALANAGLTVGIYDTNQATLDRIAAGEMPFMETGADDLLREVLASGRLHFGSDGSMIERTEQLIVVIGTPVDEFLGAVDDDLREGRRPDRPTPARGGAGRAAQHRLPRDDRVRDPEPRRPRLQGRRRVLPGAHRRGPRARGAQLAAADRRRGLDGRRDPRRRPSSAVCRRRPSGPRPRRPSSPSSSPTPGAT